MSLFFSMVSFLLELHMGCHGKKGRIAPEETKQGLLTQSTLSTDNIQDMSNWLMLFAICAPALLRLGIAPALAAVLAAG